MSQTHSLTPSLTRCLSLSAITLLFVDRFGRSIWPSQLEFDEKASYDGLMAHSRVFRRGFEF